MSGTSEHLYDRPNVAATLNGTALFHTGKCCTNTVARLLCPPFVRIPVENLTDHIRVGLVRHPLDRLVSCWADTTRPHRVFLIEMSRKHRIPIEGTYANMPFDEFAEVVMKQPGMNAHWIPQAWWLNVGRLPDHIIHFENIREEWAPFVEQYGWPEFPEQKLNASEHAHWTEVIPEHLLPRLVNTYADDFDTFGYERPC